MVRNIVKSNTIMCVLIVLILLLSNTTFAQTSKNGLADKVQNKYDSIKGFTAEFKQVLNNSDAELLLEEKGTLKIMKGGLMRWDYNEPEEKLFICDGKDCYMYLKEENLVQLISMKNLDTKSSPMMFFTGKGNLKRDFKVRELIQDPSKQSSEQFAILELRPRAETERFNYIIAYVDLKTYFINRLRVVDLVGNETDYFFMNVREQKFNTDNFKFTPPEGVEIVKVEE